MATASSDSDAADEPQVLFSLEFLPTGDPGSKFNADIKNNPLSPWQRKQILQRKGAFNLQCTSIDIVHGKFGPADPAAYASLFVLKFWFDKRRLGRRIASADITLEFSGMDKEGDASPEVFAITPHDRAALVPTAVHVEHTQEAALRAGGSSSGLEVAGNYTWKKVTTQDVTAATTVTGSIDMGEGCVSGEPSAASWTLLENERDMTGVPSTLQVGVLLKRENTQPFQCVVDVKAKADKATMWEWFWASKSHDDAVLFNPNLKPTSSRYDPSNLGTVMERPLWEAGLVGAVNPARAGGAA